LVDKSVQVRVVDFGEGVHKQTHDVLYATARSLFVELVNEAADKEKGGIQHWTAIFTMVLRVRQACCHAGLVDPALLRRVEEIDSGIQDGLFDAADVNRLVSMLFGDEQLNLSMDEGDVADGMTNAGPSPKMEALFKGIKAMKKGEKAVIFSQVSRHQEATGHLDYNCRAPRAERASDECSIARSLVITVDVLFGRLRRDFLPKLSMSTSQLLLVESVESSSAWDLVKLVHDPRSDD
jgi:hypothetical protein